MQPRFRLYRPILFLAALVSIAFAQSAKRPLNHHDYDGWRSISAQRLSADGHFLAYGLFPQEGDGEVVVRNLVTGKETRYPAGMRPAPAPASDPEEGPPGVARSVTIEFSADSHTLVFSTFPSKADADKARKEKKTGDQAPKDGMVVIDLASNNVTRIERVRRFQMPERHPAISPIFESRRRRQPATRPRKRNPKAVSPISRPGAEDAAGVEAGPEEPRAPNSAAI